VQAAIPVVVSPAKSGKVARLSPREQQFVQLVNERTRAIESSFGETFSPSVTELRIVFVSSRELGNERQAAYDPEARTLYFARDLQYANAPLSNKATSNYWPWYQQPARDYYPVVGIIDGALWTAVLKEVAHSYDLAWPHEQCNSPDVAERLPCEMLMYGIVAYTTQIKAPLFNENRISEIWPEDFREFCVRHWQQGDQAYLDVRKFGGYLLLRPLVREFGVVRTLSYVARTPFRVEQNNLRLSAEQYQLHAREALTW
jgi:hypothetical protein